MSASVADILRAHGFVPAVPAVSPPGGDAETQAGRHVPVVPNVPTEKYKGAIDAEKTPAVEPARTRVVAEYRLNANPSQWLIVLGAPGEAFDHIRHDLQVKYGGRLVQVRQHVVRATQGT